MYFLSLCVFKKKLLYFLFKDFTVLFINSLSMTVCIHFLFFLQHLSTFFKGYNIYLEVFFIWSWLSKNLQLCIYSVLWPEEPNLKLLSHGLAFPFWGSAYHKALQLALPPLGQWEWNLMFVGPGLELVYLPQHLEVSRSMHGVVGVSTYSPDYA